jgi:hypothetical protein
MKLMIQMEMILLQNYLRYLKKNKNLYLYGIQI